MYISSNHHVVAVRTGVRRLASANGTAPAAGDVVSTDVTIANGELDEDDTSTVGHTSAVEIQAQIVSVGAGTVTLLINGVQVPVSLPAGLTLPASVVGQTVSLKLDLDQQAADDEQGENEDPGDDDGGDDD
jgi:hypothetical protein